MEYTTENQHETQYIVKVWKMIFFLLPKTGDVHHSMFIFKCVIQEDG